MTSRRAGCRRGAVWVGSRCTGGWCEGAACAGRALCARAGGAESWRELARLVAPPRRPPRPHRSTSRHAALTSLGGRPARWAPHRDSCCALSASSRIPDRDLASPLRATRHPPLGRFLVLASPRRSSSSRTRARGACDGADPPVIRPAGATIRSSHRTSAAARLPPLPVQAPAAVFSHPAPVRA